MRKVGVGAWRDDRTGPRQVVSGAVGRERVHFEAPSADRLDAESESACVSTGCEDGHADVPRA